MKWLVTSPEYEETYPVLDYGQGPSFPVRDVVWVEAETQREAIVRGVQQMRKEFPNGWHNYWVGNENPFRGMEAVSEASLILQGLLDEEDRPREINQ